MEPKAASTSLLKGRSVYAEASPTTTVAFKNALASLPTDVRNGLFFVRAATGAGQRFLERFETRMLRTLAEAQVERVLRGVPNTYFDHVLQNSPAKYAAFARRYAKLGMLSYPAMLI